MSNEMLRGAMSVCDRKRRMDGGSDSGGMAAGTGEDSGGMAAGTGEDSGDMAAGTGEDSGDMAAGIGEDSGDIGGSRMEQEPRIGREGCAQKSDCSANSTSMTHKMRMAFIMAIHPRLGAASPARLLPAQILRKVLRFVPPWFRHLRLCSTLTGHTAAVFTAIADQVPLTKMCPRITATFCVCFSGPA